MLCGSGRRGAEGGLEKIVAATSAGRRLCAVIVLRLDKALMAIISKQWPGIWKKSQSVRARSMGV